MKNKKKCPSNKILNPASGRCVLKTGAIGKRLIRTPIPKPRTKAPLPRTRAAPIPPPRTTSSHGSQSKFSLKNNIWNDYQGEPGRGFDILESQRMKIKDNFWVIVYPEGLRPQMLLFSDNHPDSPLFKKYTIKEIVQKGTYRKNGFWYFNRRSYGEILLPSAKQLRTLPKKKKFGPTEGPFWKEEKHYLQHKAMIDATDVRMRAWKNNKTFFNKDI